MPTQFPGWRVLSFFLALWNTFILIGGAMLYFNPSSGPLFAAGWVTSIDPHSAPHFYSLVLSMGLTIVGALLSRVNPARGFLLFGAGYLAASISMLVLIPWNPSLLAAQAFFLAPGVWYTRLGLKQLEGDRRRSV